MISRVRTCVLSLCVLLLVPLIASGASALEKTAVRIGDLDRPDDWSASTTCQIAYYNYCTGWLWTWGGWSPNDVIGVCYESCCDHQWTHAPLGVTWELVYTAAPPGRCFTGTIDIWGVDQNCCPASHLASQPFYFGSGWNGHGWSIWVPPDFLVTVAFGPCPGTPARLASDHPAPGPTGPAACGTCYQLNRLTHSYYYGTSTTMLCPGERPNDGVCDVEWIWDVALFCGISVEASSWARMKALYR